MTKKKRKTRDQWSVARWKKEAKIVFQRYCRLRDSNAEGYVKCCTCGKIGFWEGDGFDGGHFIRATHSVSCFDERNVHAQCSGCNNWGDGKWEIYSQFIKSKYGEAVLLELLDSAGKIRKFKIYELQQIIQEYTDKTIGLQMQKGL